MAEGRLNPVMAALQWHMRRLTDVELGDGWQAPDRPGGRLGRGKREAPAAAKGQSRGGGRREGGTLAAKEATPVPS